MVILLVGDREDHNKEVKQQNRPVNGQIEDIKKTQNEGDESPDEESLPEFEFSDFSDDRFVFAGSVESGLFHLLGDVVHLFLVFLKLTFHRLKEGGRISLYFIKFGVNR